MRCTTESANVDSHDCVEVRHAQALTTKIRIIMLRSLRWKHVSNDVGHSQVLWKQLTAKRRSVLHRQLSIRQHVEDATGNTDNDNDNDTLREVPHPSNEGLALQARVLGS